MSLFKNLKVKKLKLNSERLANFSVFRQEMTSVFDKVSLRQVRVLSEILQKSTLMQTEFVKKRYLETAPNFDETIDFLREMKLIQLRRNQIILKAEYQTLLRQLSNSAKPEQLIAELLVSRFMNKRSNISKKMDKFLVNFQFKNGQYEFAPTTAKRLKYSGLRNFLIELGLVHLDSKEMKYLIDTNYMVNYSILRETRPISPEEFSQIQQGRIDIGNKAELIIVKYEKERLSKFPSLVAKIEHTAKVDATVGYDIISFDFDQEENPIPRFIEVKAVSPWDYRFYWTGNEIATSRLHQKNYCLYLLPVRAHGEFDLEGLKIISDPYINVYKKREEWIRKDELISFSLQRFKKFVLDAI